MIPRGSGESAVFLRGMSEENNAGAAYLAALKRSTPQAAGAAPARAPVSPPENRATDNISPGRENPIVEKRRSPRYRCQGSAHLREISSGVATWATFTDISMHGCYVEAMSTFRVGARLRLTLEVNGFRVESGAEVRVVYPNLGMGISFTTMPDSDRERLCELLRSLSRPSVILSPQSVPNPQPIPHLTLNPPPSRIRRRLCRR
ncbi:MAG: PilZ domain-containing protein [Candidatus Sulfotelmatobacter sp.]